MMNYKVLFIDEEERQHDIFMDYFEAICPDIEPKCVLPKPSLGEMMALIDELHPDAIVTDYRLNEIKLHFNYTVKYNGTELVKYIREQLYNFPCFVVTSFDDDAINDSDDVNLVYIKDILKPNNENDNAKMSFAERVKNQINKYRTKQESTKEELSKLIAKRNRGEANVQDEGRIIELDSQLEKAYDASSSIPSELKSLSNIERLNSLIDKVDILIKKWQ